MEASHVVSEMPEKVSSNYSMRVPSMEEIRSAFGSLTRAVECCRGDLPTLCFFLANPHKIAGFKRQAGVRHRNDNVAFSQELRRAAKAERDAVKTAKAAAEMAAIRPAVLAWLLKYRSPADPIPVAVVVAEMKKQGMTLTSKQFRAAIKGSVWKTH